MLKREEIEAIKIRATKNLKPESQTLADIAKLHYSLISLQKENFVLKNNLLELEQAVPEEQQWQNVIANKIERALLAGGKNYLEINNSINNETYTISIQRKFGKTPKQLFDQSEIRRLKASKRILNLLKEKRTLELVLGTLRKENDAIKKLASPHIDSKVEAVNRERLESMINIVNDLIHNWSSALYRRGLNKLHTSTNASFQEAWGRVVAAETKARELLEENKKLKQAIFKKESPICRIYKKRQKGREKRLHRRSF